jgi:hypothetical protein
MTRDFSDEVDVGRIQELDERPPKYDAAALRSTVGNYEPSIRVIWSVRASALADPRKALVVCASQLVSSVSLYLE